MNDDKQKRIEEFIKETGQDERAARFAIALADGELTGDIEGDEALEEKVTLGDVVRAGRKE